MKLLRIAITLILLFTTVNSYAGYTICQSTQGFGVGDGTIRYPCILSPLQPSGSETDQQTIYRTAGIISFAGIYISSNDVSSASTAAIRVNTVTSVVTISVTGNTTGMFTDEVHSKNIVAGDRVNWIIDVPSVAGAHTLIPENVFYRFLATTNTSQELMADDKSETITYGSTTINYIGLGDFLTFGTTEANVQFTYRTAGTLKNGQTKLFANTRDSATTISSRVNTAPGNIAVSITASTSGFFEDNVGTDTIKPGDIVDMAILGTTGTGTGTFTTVGMEFVTTNRKSHNYFSANTGVAHTASAVYFFPLTGYGLSTLIKTEAYKQYKAGFAFTASNLQLYVLSPNGATGAGTFDFRIGGLSKNQSISITGSTSGLFEDTSDSDIVAQGNLVNYRFLVGSGGNTTISQAGCMIAEKAAQKSMAFILD